MTSTLPLLLDAIRSQVGDYALALKVDESDESISIQPPAGSPEHCAATLTLIGDLAADVALGPHLHFDTYADSADKLVDELVQVVAKVLAGAVIEERWLDSAGTCVVATVLLGDERFSWRKGLRSKHGKTHERILYLRYPRLVDPPAPN